MNDPEIQTADEGEPFSVAIVGEDGRLTLSASLCRKYGLKPGDRLEVIGEALVGLPQSCSPRLLLFQPGDFDLGAMEETLNRMERVSEELPYSVLDAFGLFL